MAAHSVVGPGDPAQQWQRVPALWLSLQSRACTAGKPQGGDSEMPSHLPAFLFFQWVEGCRTKLSVILSATHLWTSPSPTHPRP